MIFKHILFSLILIFLSTAFTNPNFKSKTELIARKWVMQDMTVEGRTYSEEMVERQRRNGLVTILQFSKSGACYVIIKTRKGRTTKKNKWQFLENETKLEIQPEKNKLETQVFNIEKLSSKKMTLSLEDNGTKQVFTYKVLKE